MLFFVCVWSLRRPCDAKPHVRRFRILLDFRSELKRACVDRIYGVFHSHGGTPKMDGL